MKNSIIKKTGFTLTEIIIVTIIVGIMGAFAITSFRTGIQRSRESQALLQVQYIHGLITMHKAKTGGNPPGQDSTYYPDDQVDQVLGVKLDRSMFRYNYSKGTGPSWSANVFDDEIGIGTAVHFTWVPLGGKNPCCTVIHEECISIPQCDP